MTLVRQPHHNNWLSRTDLTTHNRMLGQCVHPSIRRQLKELKRRLYLHHPYCGTVRRRAQIKLVRRPSESYAGHVLPVLLLFIPPSETRSFLTSVNH